MAVFISTAELPAETINVRPYINEINYEIPAYNYASGETDDPIISSTSFRMLCDHRIDYETSAFDTSSIRRGDTIFVAYHLLIPFVDRIHPLIPYPYILVTNETTANHPPPGTESLISDPKCAAWFSKNMVLSGHPKLFQIPVGQTCYEWHHIKPFLPQLLTLSRGGDRKEFSAFLRIENTFLETRSDALRTLMDAPFVHYHPDKMPPDEYYKHLAASQFVIAPHGGGYDSCRFWESILLHSIPIVTHSPLDDMYKGTPCVIIEKWSDLNEEMLLEKQRRIAALLDAGLLSYAKGDFSYWKGLIAAVQDKVRDGSWENSEPAAADLPVSDIERLRSIFLESPAEDMYIIGDGLSTRSYQYLAEFPDYSRITVLDRFMARHQDGQKPFSADADLLSHNPALTCKLTSYSDPHLEHTSEVLKSKELPVHVLFDLSYYQYEFDARLDQIWNSLPPGSVVVVTNARRRYVRHKMDAFFQRLELKNMRPRDEPVFILRKGEL